MTEVVLDELGPVKFLLEKDTMEIYIDVNGDKQPITKATFTGIKKKLEKCEKVKLAIGKMSKQDRTWKTGDRVFLYGPTGTGKTYGILDWIHGEKLPYECVTVSDGFEDIDFLTYIVPTKTGIQYKAKKIVDLLRRASKGEKVAILIDEVNRGSKSFMNMLLKMMDPVTDEYEINNFIEDEVIRIPKDNIIWFCTANLGGGYSGTNDLDEALLDRFNQVKFVGYNDQFEKELLKNFGDYSSEAKKIVDYIRALFNDNALKRPISSRSLKVWAEEFVNTSGTSGDVFNSFEQTVLYRLVSVDNYGFPSQEDVGVIVSKFMELGVSS